MTVQNDLAEVAASAGFAGIMAGLFTTFFAAFSFYLITYAIYSVISLFT
jgi:hypothetical protein